MSSLSVNLTTVPKELATLAKSFSGTIQKIEEGYELSIDRNIGYGVIKYIALEKGINVLNFAVTLYHDIKISVDLFELNTIQFLYCLEGNCFHKFEKPMEVTSMSSFQSAILYYKNGLSSKLIIQPGDPFLLNIIVVNKDTNYFEGDFKNPHQESFAKITSLIESKNSFFQLGNYNLPIAELLQANVKEDHENKFTRVLSNKGRYYLALALHLEQFIEDIEGAHNTSGLQKRELALIAKTSHYIKEFPQLLHSIKALYEYSGLSPAKLQDGFKYVYNKTVSEYVRSIRLEKAEELIRNSDLSISEIVYTVGLTSRSYFCKIFKKRFHFSPKEYRCRNKILV